MNSHFEKSVNKQDAKKPVCLILDEIDGALGGGGSSANDGQLRGLKMVADYL